jgi:hypothetical protein
MNFLLGLGPVAARRKNKRKQRGVKMSQVKKIRVSYIKIALSVIKNVTVVLDKQQYRSKRH